MSGVEVKVTAYLTVSDFTPDELRQEYTPSEMQKDIERALKSGSMAIVFDKVEVVVEYAPS